MTPKEKAERLVFKFRDIKDAYYIDDMAKERALIAVDEIIEAVKIAQTSIYEYVEYWQEVRNEIEKL